MKQAKINNEAKGKSFVLKMNGFFPNSSLPVIVYEKAFELPGQKNVAAEFIQKIFAKHDWKNSWKDGIYDFHHYHSTTHECIGICKGEAVIVLGGPNGKRIMVKAGDVMILPAGTGHMCKDSSEDFLCVGAYPEGKDYDMNYGTAVEFQNAIKNISALPIPETDPVFGKKGELQMLWVRQRIAV